MDWHWLEDGVLKVCFHRGSYDGCRYQYWDFNWILEIIDFFTF